jgi:hypothetical protein
MAAKGEQAKSKNLFHFLGLNYDGLLFLSLEAAVMLPGNFFF